MFRIVIPARYESTRLPGKPLVDIGGMPMIKHVYQRALETNADSILIATDDERIAEVCQGFNAEVFISNKDHQSGTERIAEVISEYEYADNDIIVNLQADEPFLPASLLNQVASTLSDQTDAPMASLYIPLETHSDVFNSNIVKVVMDKNGYALYFSRAAIPWIRGVFDKQDKNDFDLTLFNRHIGVYAYYAWFVKQYITLPLSPIEHPACLEQLRVLWNGYKIKLSGAEQVPGQEINTAEDLAKAREIYKKMS